jgi:hypothetical protein
MLPLMQLRSFHVTHLVKLLLLSLNVLLPFAPALRQSLKLICLGVMDAFRLQPGHLSLHL